MGSLSGKFMIKNPSSSYGPVATDNCVETITLLCPNLIGPDVDNVLIIEFIDRASFGPVIIK